MDSDLTDERNVLTAFAAKHPELLGVDMPTDIRNKEIIVDLLVKGTGLPVTPENLELAYRVALDAGEITLGTYSPQELEAFGQMSTKQLAGYLEWKFQAPPKPNMAELLPEFGERRWRNEESTMTDEQSQVLRDKLLKGAGW